MATNFWWRLANGGNGQPGPVQAGVTEDQATGSWAVVDGIPPDTAYQVSLVSANGPWSDRRTFALVPQPDRVPPVTRTFGDRPNVKPASYYEAGRAEFLDPVAHPHIMGVTHRTVKSGRFTDPTVWSTGTVPGAGAVWAVAAGHILIGDNNSDVIFKDALVEFGGTFRLAKDTETRWRMDTFMAMSPIVFEDPGAVAGKPKHEFIWHIQQAPGATTRGGLMAMSSVRIHGAKKRSHLNVGLSSEQVAAGETAPAVMAGATRVYLPGLSQSGWRIGQEMMFGGTEYVPLASSDPQYTGPSQYFSAHTPINKTVQLNQFQFGQEEQRTISGFDGDWALFEEPLVYDHIGIRETLPRGEVVTIPPIVGNPSQSIEMRSASFEQDGDLDPTADLSDLQKRAHFMTMRSEDVDIRYLSIQNMARTDTNPTLSVVNSNPLLSGPGGTPLADPNNVRGRYGLHLHWNGGPYLNSRLIVVKGVSVWAPLWAPPIPGWAMTQHGTRAAFEDCFTFNVRGAGFVSELGNETGQWVNLLAMAVRGDGETTVYSQRAEEYTNHNDSAGHGFGNQSRVILMHGCRAVSCKYGAVWHAQKTEKQGRAIRDIDLPFKDGLNSGVGNVFEFNDEEGIGANITQIPPFIDNHFIACWAGFVVIHRLASYPGVGGNDNTPMLMEDFHTLNCLRPWYIPEYSNSYYILNSLIKMPDNIGSEKTAFWMGQVSWAWNFSNVRVIGSDVAFRDAGVGENYNGFFMDCVVDDGAFAAPRGITTRTNLTTSTYWGVMGGEVTIDANNGRMRQFASITAADFPQPFPKAPYGYGDSLPAGYEFPEPGEPPYFIPGSAFNNGANWNTVVNVVTPWVAPLSLHGMIVDSVGIMKWPDSQSYETYPTNMGVKSPRTVGSLSYHQLVRRWGCWNDNGTWKCRAWWPIADRYLHTRSWFHIDITLTNVLESFWLEHDLGGPSQHPDWPVQLDIIDGNPPPLVPEERDIGFLSRSRLEVVAGQQLAHNIHVDHVNVRLTIVGGADAALFRIASRQLQWASNGTRPLGSQNEYRVVVRASDEWGNYTDQEHQVVVVTSDRWQAVISDTFTQPDGTLLDSNPNYIMRRGPSSTFSISGGRPQQTVGVASGAQPSFLDFGSVGSSDQKATLNFPSDTPCWFAMRVVDENNWIGFQRREGANPALNVAMCVAGVITVIGSFSSPTGNRCSFELRSNRLVCMTNVEVANNKPVRQYPRVGSQLTVAGFSEFERHGVLLLPANCPVGVNIGLAATSPWAAGGIIDNIVVERVPS